MKKGTIAISALDIMIETNFAGESTLFFYYNYLNSDNFFMKAITYFDLEQTYFSQIGTSYQFIATDISGKRTPQNGIQYYQTAYSPLQLPFSFMGVGRSNNYIEHLTIYSPNCSTIKSYTPIVPNSQIRLSSANISKYRINKQMQMGDRH